MKRLESQLFFNHQNGKTGARARCRELVQKVQRTQRLGKLQAQHMLDLWPCNQSAKGWAWLVYALWEGGVGQPVGLRPTKDHKVFPRCQEKLLRLRKDV